MWIINVVVLCVHFAAPVTVYSLCELLFYLEFWVLFCNVQNSRIVSKVEQYCGGTFHRLLLGFYQSFLYWMMYGYSTYSAYTLLNYWQHTAHGHKSERDYGVDKRSFLNIILMAWCKTVETPLLAHCSCTKSSIYGRMALWCMLSTNFIIYSYGIMCFEWIFFQNNTIWLRFCPHPWRAHACRWSKSMFCIEKKNKNKTKQNKKWNGMAL